MSDGWYPDPYNRHELRYFGGGTWTEHVSTSGAVAVDRVNAAADPGAVAMWWTSKRGAGAYLGSHPSRPDRVERLGVGFLSLGFAAVDESDRMVLSLAWENISSVAVETADSIRSRINPTWVLLFGAIGLLAKKTTHTAFMTLTDQRGQWVFAVEDQDAAGLWSELLPVKARVPALFTFGVASAPATLPMPPPIPGAATPKERLQSLDALRSDGVITEDEWARRRADIIASI